MKNEQGFTFIEVLVSITLLVIFSAILVVGYSAISRGSELKAAAFKVLDILNLAHTRTVASLATASYGVHFEQFQYALFKGTTYNAADPNTIFYPLPSTLEIAGITLAGAGSDVVFDRLTGKTAQNGSLAVRLIADASRSKTITILASGRADIIESALTPGNTRIADTRHMHFTYGQNISSVTNLVLNFPNDAVTQNISFPSYYSGGVFDWSGTIMVGGLPQTLRVHTHATSGSSADFSVTRDLRYNTVSKPLEISLDSFNIVSYSNTGDVIKGLSSLAYPPVSQ